MGNANRKSDSASLLTLAPDPDAISLAMATLISCKNGSCPGGVTMQAGSGADQRHAAKKPEANVLAAVSTHDDDSSPPLPFADSWTHLDDCVIGNDDDDDGTLGCWRTKAVVVVPVIETQRAASKRADRATTEDFIMTLFTNSINHVLVQKKDAQICFDSFFPSRRWMDYFAVSLQALSLFFVVVNCFSRSLRS